MHGWNMLKGMKEATGGSPAEMARRLYYDTLVYDADTLKEVWSFGLGTPITAPPMSYSVNGKQYIAVIAGGTAELRGARLYQPGAIVAVFGL